MRLLDPPLRRLARSRLAATLTWPHGVERYTELLDPAWSLEAIRARIVAVHHQTADTVTLRLRPNPNWPGHAAGQHVVVTVEVDGVRRARSFSVASSAHDRSIELTCKAGPGSVVSRHLRERAAPGDVVDLSPPSGDFVLPAPRPDAVALVSAGSGITPVLSMLRTLHDEATEAAEATDTTRDAAARDVAFLHYARSSRDVLYGAEVRRLVGAHRSWRSRTVTELARAGHRTGRFHPSHLAGAGVDPARHELFCCGPPPFMDAVAAAWEAAGGPAERFHVESFAGPRPLRSLPAGTVRFRRTGLDLVSDGRPILQQAEAAGLRPAHGCRMGICRTCVTTKVSGCVQDATTGARDTEAGTSVRICVSVPDGDVELDL